MHRLDALQQERPLQGSRRHEAIRRMGTDRRLRTGAAILRRSSIGGAAHDVLEPSKTLEMTQPWKEHLGTSEGRFCGSAMLRRSRSVPGSASPCGPNLEKIGRDLVDVGPRLVNVGPTLVKHGQLRATFGKFRTEFGRFRANFGRFYADWSKSVQSRSNSVHIWSIQGSAQVCPIDGQLWPDIDRLRPTFGQVRPNSGDFDRSHARLVNRIVDRFAGCAQLHGLYS